MSLRPLLCALFGPWLGRYCEARSAVLRVDEPTPEYEVPVFPLELEEVNMTEKTMRTDQGIDVHFKPLRADGSVATVDGVPSWGVVTDNPLLSVAVAGDGMSARITAPHELAGTDVNVQLTVTADADLDEGETREIVASSEILLHLVAAEAVFAQLEVDEPNPNPIVD